MNDEQQQPVPSSALGPEDVIYILFRHKKKIIFFLILGLLAAAAVFKTHKPVYRSVAKLLIRYVTDSRALASAPADQEVVKSPDSYNSSVVNSEIEILRSRDLARSIARRIGPEKILAAYGGGREEAEAAGLLMQNLTVEVGRNSAVMNVTLFHRDPTIARDALKFWIEAYLERHIEIHRSIGTYDLIQRQADQLHTSLNDAEEQLRLEKTKANIVSVDQSRTEVATRLASLRTAQSTTESEIAQARARIDSFQGTGVAETNWNSGAVTTQTNRPAPFAPVDPNDLARYQRLSAHLATLRARETDYLGIYTPQSRMVEQLRQQIAQTEDAIEELGIDPTNPGTQAPTFNPAQLPIAPLFDLNSERRQLAALEAKLRNVNGQIIKAQEEARALDTAESTIVALQRKRDMFLEQSRNLQRSLDRARVDQTLDAGKINNISPIQEPTISTRDMGAFQKLVLMAFAVPVGFGLALAFALELFLDPSVKRSKDLERSLGMRVFATIPSFGRNGKALRLKGPPQDEPTGSAIALRTGEIAPWDERDPMAPYYEALRDRILMTYSGDLHCPKIVGLTSCNSGAGVTRIASGLAAALSRDAERNILFVALEKNRVAVSAFHRGRPVEEANGIVPNHEQGLIQQNLQSLATTGRNLSGASIMQSFTEMMPRLRASDYDYVVFDLPPLTQTSGALRLAAQMERTVLVVEAEETNKDSVRRAKDLLAGPGKEVFAVLNKTKTYGGKLLQGDV